MSSKNDGVLEKDYISLYEALTSGDAETAGTILRERSSLTRDKIDLLADLFLDPDKLRTIHPFHLVFKRRKGRPSDPFAEKFSSQERARAIERLIREGVKVEAAVEYVHEKTRVARSTLKRDRSRYRRISPKK